MENMKSIPFPFPKVAVLGIREVGDEIRRRGVADMKIAEQKQADTSHRAEINMSVSKCTVFVGSSCLVMFGIVRQKSM
jgi:hypothetical protein